MCISSPSLSYSSFLNLDKPKGLDGEEELASGENAETFIS